MFEFCFIYLFFFQNCKGKYRRMIIWNLLFSETSEMTLENENTVQK